MADIADVLVALASRVKTGIGSDALSGRVFPYVPDSMVTPWAVVLPAGEQFVNYDLTFDGAEDFPMLVKVIVGSEMTRPAQERLLGYMDRTGTTSLRAAVYGDPTLGGVVSYVDVLGWQNYGDVEWAGVVYYGAEMLVTAST